MVYKRFANKETRFRWIFEKREKIISLKQDFIKNNSKMSIL